MNLGLLLPLFDDDKYMYFLTRVGNVRKVRVESTR